MPLSPSPLSRFLGLVRRIAPFLLVWLGIVALPASREPLQLQLGGSQFTPGLNPPWREDMRPDPRFDAFAALARNPGDLDARVWRFSQMLEGKSGGFDPSGEPNRRIPRAGELLREARALRDAFPEHPWLASLPMRVLHPQLSQWRGKSTGTDKNLSAGHARELATWTREAEQMDAGNAYYPLLEAGFWLRAKDSAAMWAALDRAAAGQFFDPHDLDWALAIVRAHDAARPLKLEEKDALWKANSGSGASGLDEWPGFLWDQARQAQKRGDHGRALHIAEILGNIGDGMQRGRNTRAMASAGRTWKGQVQTLVYRVWPPKPRVKPVMWARSFGAYARAHGRPDLATRSERWNKRQSQLYRLSLYLPDGSYPAHKPPKDAMARVEEWRGAGMMVGMHLLLVAAAWVLVNGIMWRGVGAPSSRLDRTVPAATVAALGVGASLWAWRQFDILEASRWSPSRIRYEIAVGTVAVVAFVGAPFLLAIWAAAATLWTRRREFLKPARIETELRLSPGQILMLRSGPTIVCAAALVFTFGFWGIYLTLVAFDVSSIDLLGWLPDNGQLTNWDLSVPTEALFAPILYLLLVDFVAWLLWFNKWRYYAGKESRPLTHGGLRRWKEMLGMYLVIGGAVYLGVALVGWPHRARASRELETRMTRGELPP